MFILQFIIHRFALLLKWYFVAYDAQARLLPHVLDLSRQINTFSNMYAHAAPAINVHFHIYECGEGLMPRAAKLL
jgi:hypothetical protein